MQVPVDIAFPTVKRDAGAAIDWQQQQAEDLPLLRPLCLLLKAMLAQRDLNDPSKGGLGGYSLVNMIVYYLRCPAVLFVIQV